MKTPKLSIGLPVFNGEKYIEQALDSLLKQDFNDFEIIISDNASTDRTQEICRHYAQMDIRIRYIRSDTNRGAAWNYNSVFNAARGEYFKWATHDDVCLPGFFSECVQVLETVPNCVLVYTKSEFIGENGESLYEDSDNLEARHPSPRARLAHVLRNVNLANAVFGVMRADTLRKTRLIDWFIASDYVLLAELALLGEICEVKKTLFLKRNHREASRYANRTNAEVQLWFNPGRRLKGGVLHRHFPRLMVRSRLVWEWMRSVLRLPLSRPQRLACLLTVPFAYFGEIARCYGGMWKARFSASLRGATVATES